MFRSLTLRHLLLPAALLLCPSAASAKPVDLFFVYATALEKDPRVQIAIQRVKASKARADASLGVLLPQASAYYNLSDNEVDYSSNRFPKEHFDGERYSVQVRQTLFDWAAISSRRRANQLLAQQESELLDTMSMLLVDTARRYFNVLLADNNLGLIQAELELVQQQLRQTDEMYERKLVRVTDLLETQARADKVLTDVIEAENQAALTREALAELTGEHIGDIAPVREDFTLPALENDMEYWVRLATGNNSLLRSKQEAVVAARAGVQERKGGHYPTVGLIFSDQTSDLGFDNQASPKRNTQYIGLDVALPLYAGGATSAGVREAWANYYMAREEEESVRREVLKRTREAWLNTRSSRRRIDAAQASVRSATKSYEAMSKSFTYGTVTAADVLEALHARTRSERDYQTALYEYVVHWLTLKREGGALEGGDLEQVNGRLLAGAL